MLSIMGIRRNSTMNVANALAVGYPVGLIVDAEKGNSVKYAKEGRFALKNIIFPNMGVIGTDKNKEYSDCFFDYATGMEGCSCVSYSHSFFFSEPTNREMSEAALNLTDPKGTG